MDDGSLSMDKETLLGPNMPKLSPMGHKSGNAAGTVRKNRLQQPDTLQVPRTLLRVSDSGE